MTQAKGGWCAACKTPQPLAELLIVTDLATGRTRYVCRPTKRGSCFSWVRSAAAESIAIADQEAWHYNATHRRWSANGKVIEQRKALSR